MDKNVLTSLLRDSKEKPKEKKNNHEIIIRLLLSQEKDEGDKYVKTQESHYVG